MKKFKIDLLFYTLIGIVLSSIAEDIEGWINIPSRIIFIVAVVLAGIPLFFLIKDWIKK